MILILFSVCCSIVVFLFFYGFIRKEIQPEVQVHKRVLAFQENNYAQGTKENRVRQLKEIPFVERVIQPFSRYIEEFVNKLTPKQLRNLILRRINIAGKSEQWSVNDFIFASLLGGLLMGGFILILIGDSSYHIVQKMVFTLLAGLMGGAMPTMFLNITIEKRQMAIQEQLPEVLDLLCVSVQAGLSFDASLNKIVGRMKGPFIDECKRMQEEIRMGMMRRTAMRHVAEHCQVQDVSLFITSLIQAERLGTSMGNTLKNQADNIRERRRQSVKAKAMKAPVKMIFPLVFFIFPSLFVITLLPSILVFVKSMLR